MTANEHISYLLENETLISIYPSDFPVSQYVKLNMVDNNLVLKGALEEEIHDESIDENIYNAKLISGRYFCNENGRIYTAIGIFQRINTKLFYVLVEVAETYYAMPLFYFFGRNPVKVSPFIHRFIYCGDATHITTLSLAIPIYGYMSKDLTNTFTDENYIEYDKMRTITNYYDIKSYSSWFNGIPHSCK